MTALVLRACAGEPELLDPAITGEFAGEMARITASTHTPPWCGYIARANRAKGVFAHTLPEVGASTRVLEKCGFRRDGWGIDNDVGAVWRWRNAEPDR